MKILFMTNIPSPYRVDFFNELGKHCDVTVLFERKKASDRNKDWLSSTNNNFEAIFMKGLNIGNESAICPSVITHINKSEYDFVIIGGYSTPTGVIAIKYLSRKKVPFIINVDGGIIRDDSKFKMSIKSSLISSASAWLSTGKEATNYLIHYGALKNRIFEYPFSSIKEEDILGEHSLKKIEKSVLRNEIGITEKKVVLAVGQIIHRKGFDIIIETAKDTREIGFYIVGGEPTKAYQNMLERWNLQNIHFVGFKNKSELRKYYLAADLFVLPTREDIWGLVINEAMANGLPIITTDKCVAGLELIENGVNGYRIPSEDSNKLTQIIEDVIHDQHTLNKISVNNLIKIKNYTIESMAKRHIEILKIMKNKI